MADLKALALNLVLYKVGWVSGVTTAAAADQAVVLRPSPWVAMGSLAVAWVLAMPLMTWMASGNSELLHSATYRKKKLSPV